MSIVTPAKTGQDVWRRWSHARRIRDEIGNAADGIRHKQG
jgi:hypothetical protein